ncbi:MAG: hypothetical protein AABY26_04600 [Nanoarchaeota archaeon]
MTNENLEQKVSLMDELRGIARRTVGIYALALALGGVVLGGCEADKKSDGFESCYLPLGSERNNCYTSGTINNPKVCNTSEKCECSKLVSASDDDCYCSCKSGYEPSEPAECCDSTNCGPCAPYEPEPHEKGY